MKMSDVFNLPCSFERRKNDGLVLFTKWDTSFVKIYSVRSVKEECIIDDLVSYAINNHDTLKETNRLLNLECEELKGDVEKLRALVESAFREGYCAGYGDGSSDGQSYSGHTCRDDDEQWLSSDSKELLDK